MARVLLLPSSRPSSMATILKAFREHEDGYFNEPSCLHYMTYRLYFIPCVYMHYSANNNLKYINYSLHQSLIFVKYNVIHKYE